MSISNQILLHAGLTVVIGESVPPSNTGADISDEKLHADETVVYTELYV